MVHWRLERRKASWKGSFIFVNYSISVCLLNSENGKKMYEGQLEGGMPHGVGVSYL